MEFALVCIGMIVVVGVIALIANHFDKGDDEITVAEEKKKKEVEQGGSCTGDGT